jgi:hypothetical protein
MFIAALFIIAKLWYSQHASLQMNALRTCGIYTQWNFTQPQRRMNFVICRKMDGTGEHDLKQS